MDKREKIIAWLEKYGVTNYTINEDLTIDVEGNVNLSEKGLKEFPDYIRFGEVKGYFNCSLNQLTSLKGAPKEVREHFWCNNNQLTSLEGAPKEVGGYFDCCYNQLTTLKGTPKEIGGGFDCSNNQLTSLKDAPKVVKQDFDCYNNNLRSPKTLEILTKIEVGGIISI